MIVAVALLALVCFPAVAREAVRDGLALCVETVLPSLFPFFVVSSLAVQSGLAEAFARPLARFMRPLFGVGGAGATAFALGLLGGYPTGARTVAELYARGEVGREEAERLLMFCNNSGPAFFLGVCAAAFGSVRAGAYLYLVHALAAMLIAVATRQGAEVSCAPGPAKGHGISLPAAVEGAVASCVSVGANVVVFLVVLRLAAQILPIASLGALSHAALFGFVELTNGIAVLPPTRAGFVLCAAIMGWGGLSVQAQTLAVVSPVGLSLRREAGGKVLHAAASAVLAWCVAPWVL